METNSDQWRMKADAYFERAKAAAAVFSQFDQEQTDRSVEAVYRAAFNQRLRLAKMAGDEAAIVFDLAEVDFVGSNGIPLESRL